MTDAMLYDLIPNNTYIIIPLQQQGDVITDKRIINV